MRADRLIAILMLLQARQCLTAAELAQTLEVSERTIYRDIVALNSAGVPIYTLSGKGGGVGLLESYRTNLTGLNIKEVQALSMLSAPAPLLKLGIGQDLNAALRKLSAAIPDRARATEMRVRQRVFLDSSWWFQADEPAPQLATIQQAVWQDQYLKIVFRGDFEAEIAQTVAPLGLVAKANIWYFVFEHQTRVRVLRVSHILLAEMLGQTFERPAAFDLAAFWQAWCTDYESRRSRYVVTARLAPELIKVMPFIRGEKAFSVSWPSASIDKDGWRTARLTFDSYEAARMRVLGFGRAIEVLDPLALRLGVIDFAGQITELYAGLAKQNPE